MSNRVKRLRPETDIRRNGNLDFQNDSNIVYRVYEHHTAWRDGPWLNHTTGTRQFNMISGYRFIQNRSVYTIKYARKYPFTS